MKFLLLLLSFLIAAITGLAQDDSHCPIVSMSGPPGIVKPGELAEYTATVTRSGETSNLHFVWSTSSGTIESGQGTSKIKIRISKDDICPSVTVDVIGLPSNCPLHASETGCGDPPLEPTEFDTFDLPLDLISDLRFKRVADAINNNPSSQLFVFLPAVNRVRQEFHERLYKYVHGDIDLPRVTFVETNPQSKVIEIWLVPPGAAPPSKCEACEKLELAKQDCPKISIVGPAGITRPGDTMTFTSYELIGYKGTYKWTVDHGTIESGQGTPSITVRVPHDSAISNITATLELSGLDTTCVNKAAETAGINQGGDPLVADEYARLSKNEEKARLLAAFDQLRPYPEFVAAIVIRAPKNGRDVYLSRVRTIKALLTGLRLDLDKAVFIHGGNGKLSTTIYLVPRSAVTSLTRR